MRFSISYVVLLFATLVLLMASPSVDAQRHPVSLRLAVQQTEEQTTDAVDSNQPIEGRGLEGNDSAFEAYYANTHSSGRNSTPWLIAVGVLLALAAAAGIVYLVVVKRRQTEEEAKRLEMAKKRAKFLENEDQDAQPPTKRPWWKLCTRIRS
jgi:uncharacterized protein HemX